MADRVKPEDESFLVAYPYFNVNGLPSLFCLSLGYPLHQWSIKLGLTSLVIWWFTEMLVVEELYKEAVVGTNRKLIIFNGELDRIRSGCILLLYIWRLSYALVNGFCLCYHVVLHCPLWEHLALRSTFLNRRHLGLTTLTNICLSTLIPWLPKTTRHSSTRNLQSFPKHFSRNWTQFTIFTISRESKGERFSGLHSNYMPGTISSPQI